VPVTGLSTVPAGHIPAVGIRHEPPGAGWTHTCPALQMAAPQATLAALPLQAPSWSRCAPACSRSQSEAYVSPSQPQIGAANGGGAGHTEGLTTHTPVPALAAHAVV
jgi:hypothetical protein